VGWGGEFGAGGGGMGRVGVGKVINIQKCYKNELS